jgi:hypothetical protein
VRRLPRYAGAASPHCLARRALPYHGSVSRISRAFTVVLLSAVATGCGSSTAGPQSSGGYTINGSLAPAAGAGTPVQLCRERDGKLTCPA